MHDGYVTMHDILSEALPVVPVKAYSKPEYVGMTKMLSDSGPSLQTGQPAGHVVYTMHITLGVGTSQYSVTSLQGTLELVLYRKIIYGDNAVF